MEQDKAQDEINAMVLPETTDITIRGRKFKIGEMGLYQFAKFLNFYGRVGKRLKDIGNIKADTAQKEVLNFLSLCTADEVIELIAIMLDLDIAPGNPDLKYLRGMAIDDAVTVATTFIKHNKLDELTKKVARALGNPAKA